MSVIFGPRSAEDIWLAPRNTRPSRGIATTTESSWSASGIGVASTLFVRSTLTLFCTMGVMTMKMISSTSITSTIGVTLMLELTLAPSFLTASAILVLQYSGFFEHLEKFCDGQNRVNFGSDPGRRPILAAQL